MCLNLASQYFLRYAATIFSPGNIELWKVNKSGRYYEFA